MRPLTLVPLMLIVETIALLLFPSTEVKSNCSGFMMSSEWIALACWSCASHSLRFWMIAEEYTLFVVFYSASAFAVSTLVRLKKLIRQYFEFVLVTSHHGLYDRLLKMCDGSQGIHKTDEKMLNSNPKSTYPAN